MMTVDDFDPGVVIEGSVGKRIAPVVPVATGHPIHPLRHSRESGNPGEVDGRRQQYRNSSTDGPHFHTLVCRRRLLKVSWQLTTATPLITFWPLVIELLFDLETHRWLTLPAADPATNLANEPPK